MATVSPIWVIPASMGGVVLAALILRNRQNEKRPKKLVRQITVFAVGAASAAGSAFIFAQLFAPGSVMFSLTLTLLIAAWTGLLNTILRLPMPNSLLGVTEMELRLLRMPWNGVRIFGALLRNTPLRVLGGRVYLSRSGRDIRQVMEGIHAAEAVHGWSLVFTAPWLLATALHGWRPALLASLVVSLLLHLYPILHLRLALGRLQKLSRRFQEKGTPSSIPR